MQHVRQGIVLGGGGACKEQRIRLNPQGEVTNKTQYSSCKLARKIVISVLQGEKKCSSEIQIS